MTEILQLVFAHPVATFFLVAVSGMAVAGVIDSLFRPYRLRLKHRERMAEIESRTAMARALAAAPEEAQRNELAQQLLEAYGEAGEGLKNDEKGSLVRWQLSRGDD